MRRLRRNRPLPARGPRREARRGGSAIERARKVVDDDLTPLA